MCPGTDVYMPPEAVQEEPVYTEKIDCFAFGVIIVQILTRKFPKPGNRRKEVEINHPGFPSGVVEVRISEVERRQNHISTIDPNHTLLPIAFDCLKDKDVERPSAQQLCERVAFLKEGPQYSESVRAFEAISVAEQDRSDERDRELRSLRQQHSQQVQGLQQVIQLQTTQLEEKDQTITRKDQIITQTDQAVREKDETIVAGQQQLRQQVNENRQLKREKSQTIEEKSRLERQLGHVNQQLEESEQLIAQFQRQVAELEQLRLAIDTTPKSKEQSSSRASIKLIWREGKKAPCKMVISSYSAADGTTFYVRQENESVYAYTISTSSWSQLPDSPTDSCPSVITNNLLTHVGGYNSGNITNQLFSLTGEGSGRRWTKKFPPMPTKRRGSTALCTGTTLIVAGGVTKEFSMLKTVEVMNTGIEQWSTAAELPLPLWQAPAAVYGDHVCVLGKSSKVMYTCSVPTLIQSCKSFLASIRNRDARIWKQAAAPPVTLTTCVSIHNQLLAIGGLDSEWKSTTAIHMYNPTTDSWEVISQMRTPRQSCIAAVFPNNQLMVVGGYTGIRDDTRINLVEFATIEYV